LIEHQSCGTASDILLSIASSKENVRQMQRANH